MRVKEGQNIFDIALQGFGSIDYLLTDILIQNNLTFNSELKSGMEININNFNKGNKNVQEFIIINNISYCNNDEALINEYTPVIIPWILESGVWNDSGIWIDSSTWKDN